jgi:hypothetical protein
MRNIKSIELLELLKDDQLDKAAGLIYIHKIGSLFVPKTPEMSAM